MNRRHWIQRSAALGAGLIVAPSGLALPRSLPRAARATVYLDSNENPYGPSPRVMKAMQSALADGHRYPERGPLLDALATQFGLTRDHVVLGHGSFELLCTLAWAFAGPGSEVITPAPSFNVIADRAERAGATVHSVPLTSAYVLDLSAMEAAITPETDLVYICNPNNPTATIVPDDVLRPFVRRAAETALVVVDEAYAEYVTDAAYASLVDLVREGLPVVVLRTFSKIYGMAGMRIGYALARPDLAERLRGQGVGILNAAGLAGAQAALEEDGYVQVSRQRNTEAREVFRKHLRARGLEAAASHASFLWVHAGGPFNRLRQSLAEHDIVVGSDPTSDTPWGRISLGTPEQMERVGSILTTQF